MSVGYRPYRSILVLIALGAANCLTLNGYAQEVLIDFEADELGVRNGSFVSVDSPLAIFRADPLVLRNDSPEFGGTGIETAFEEGIAIDFTVPIVSLSILFGNDDPHFPEDRALLAAYHGSELIGLQTLIYNRNDLPDQTITFSNGKTFDRAVFNFVSGSLLPVSGLGEVIAEVRFRPAPEPCSLTLGSLLLLSAITCVRPRSNR